MFALRDVRQMLFGEGEIFISFALQNNDINGMTQKIRFDENGQRDEFYLEILEFSPKNGFQKIATWDQTLGINLTRNFSDLEVQIIESTQNKTLEVLSRVASPFLFKMYAL